MKIKVIQQNEFTSKFEMVDEPSDGQYGSPLPAPGVYEMVKDGEQVDFAVKILGNLLENVLDAKRVSRKLFELEHKVLALMEKVYKDEN